MRYWSKPHIVECRDYQEGVLTSIREGGTMIDYESEDLEIGTLRGK